MKHEYSLTCECGHQEFDFKTLAEAKSDARQHIKERHPTCSEIYIDRYSPIGFGGEMDLDDTYYVIRQSRKDGSWQWSKY